MCLFGRDDDDHHHQPYECLLEETRIRLRSDFGFEFFDFDRDFVCLIDHFLIHFPNSLSFLSGLFLPHSDELSERKPAAQVWGQRNYN